MTQPLMTKIAVLFFTLALSAVATAEHHTKDKKNRFPINIEQAEARASAHFAAADTNADGLLSTDEFALLQPDRPRGLRGLSGKIRKGNPRNPGLMDGQTRKSKNNKARARSAQVNPKRAAERNQMRAAAESAMFKLMDENADGLLDSDEYANADKPQLMQKARQMVAFAQFDANKDGFIAPDELPNPTAQLRQLDANNDGTVSKREMRRGLRARREADDS